MCVSPMWDKYIMLSLFIAFITLWALIMTTNLATAGSALLFHVVPLCPVLFPLCLLFSKTRLGPHQWILLCHSAIITGDNGCCSSPAQTCWINTGSGQGNTNEYNYVTNRIRPRNQTAFGELWEAFRLEYRVLKSYNWRPCYKK